MNSDGSGYVLGAGVGDTRWFLDSRMTVKAGGAHTRGALTVIEWSAPVGFGPPRHVHDAEDEMFYLLEEEMVVECGDQRWTAGRADQACAIQRQCRHRRLTPRRRGPCLVRRRR